MWYYDSITTMDKEAVVSLWISKGSPTFELVQGENCVDLEKLAKSDYYAKYAEVIKKWYEINKGEL
jgi:hypothetical protein